MEILSRLKVIPLPRNTPVADSTNKSYVSELLTEELNTDNLEPVPVVPIRKALVELLIDAEEALKIGLVSKIVEEDTLLDTGLDMAMDLLSKSPLGLRMTKDAINISMDVPSIETLIHLENTSQDVCGTSKDLLEGSTAFLQKRTPKYPLR